MAFNKENLSIAVNNMKAGSVPSVWVYYSDGDAVYGANYFAEARLTIGDLIIVIPAGAVNGQVYRVSAKSSDGFTATVVPHALQIQVAEGLDAITATALYHDISTAVTTSLLVTSAANLAKTFTTSADAQGYITLAGDIKDGVHVVLTTTTTLPAGLATSTNYYAVDSVGNKCRLSLTRGGASVAITGAGTGTHTATAQKNHFILADGYETQRKIIKVKTDGGIDAVILPGNLKDGTIITMGDVLDAVELLFADGNWQVVKNVGSVVS
jgi:hypothetical protein